MASDNLSADLASLRIQRDDPPPRSGVLRWVVVLVLVVGGGAAAFVYGAPAVEARIFRTEVSVTEVGRVSPAQASVDLTATGYVVAERTAKVAADVTGRITKVGFKEGDRVKAGDVLFTIDMGDQQNAAATLKARATAAAARAVAARATLAELDQQLAREKSLLERGAIAASGVDDLTLRRKSSEETARATEADARAASADARAQSALLRHGTVAAPMDGRIVGTPPQLGEMLLPGGVNVLSLVDFGSLVVEVDVPEGRLSLVKPGAPCEIVLDAFPDVRRRGKVKEITPRVNRSKATVVVKAEFVDVPELVLPDMAARVSFLQKALDAAAMKEPPKNVVPGVAIAERAGRKVVFVIDGSRVRLEPVTLGAAIGDGFELKEGPAPGTKLVRNPPPVLEDGKSIKERTEG